MHSSGAVTPVAAAADDLAAFAERLRRQLLRQTAHADELQRQVADERTIGTAVGFLMGHLLVPDSSAVAVLETRAEARGESLAQVARFVVTNQGLPI